MTTKSWPIVLKKYIVTIKNSILANATLGQRDYKNSEEKANRKKQTIKVDFKDFYHEHCIYVRTSWLNKGY